MTGERSQWPYSERGDGVDWLTDVRTGVATDRDGGNVVVFVFAGGPDRLACTEPGSRLIRDRETGEILAFGDPAELHADFWEQRQQYPRVHWPRYVPPPDPERG